MRKYDILHDFFSADFWDINVFGKEGKMNHHANVEKSGRLQKVLEILSDCKAHSTLEIANRADTVAAGSCISELRTNGYEIECKYKGLSDSNRKIYEYKLGGKCIP